MGDFSKTLNLLKTNFPMKGNLGQREFEWLRQLNKINIYNKIRNNKKGKKKFILHDGPPYANGKIHIGHAVNKVLKDIIVKSKNLEGFDAPYVPGWDCHGLPIEHQVEKKYGKKLTDKDFRQKCRDFANKQIELQRDDFIRLGVFGDWENPYKTMNFKTEANTIRVLSEIYKQNFLIQGFKPVFWCLDCKSALADAEVEYSDIISNSIYVKFKIQRTDLLHEKLNLKIPDEEEIFVVIWTTTPWTIPANKAVAFNPKFSYSVIKLNDQYLILSEDLVDDLFKKNKIENYINLGSISTEILSSLKLKHPITGTDIPLIPGDHVTNDTGTGFVHTAPAHGLDDFNIGKKFKLNNDSPLNDYGIFESYYSEIDGKYIWEVNKLIPKILSEKNTLLFEDSHEHSYPKCWRHKSPIIYRLTPQWFIDISGNNNNLRKINIEAIEKVIFFPKWGKDRLKTMLENRPDWCVSRQRKWGTPLPIFVHEDNNTLHPKTYSIMQDVANIVDSKGIEGWFDLHKEDLKGYDLDGYRKVTDTIDVWFDSGSTHETTKSLLDHQKPYDLYLEGSDQHRGWFQSSLIVNSAIENRAPFNQILTHGFVVDADGKKMSKSIGNVVSPQQVTNKLGADILRLWVASTDYSAELNISDEILKRVTDTYRRIRNTIRFLISNLEDFDENSFKSSNFADFSEIDMYMSNYNKVFEAKVRSLYQAYEFHTLVNYIKTYCSEQLGSFYLDIVKDRLYTEKSNSKIRKSCQSTLNEILQSLLYSLAPILSFTVNEAWICFKKDDEFGEIFLKEWTETNTQIDNEIIDKWNKILEIREKVNKEIENIRGQNIIGSSLESIVEINASSDDYKLLTSVSENLEDIFITSAVFLKLTDSKQTGIIISKHNGLKCERCWKYFNKLLEYEGINQLCDRCLKNLN